MKNAFRGLALILLVACAGEAPPEKEVVRPVEGRWNAKVRNGENTFLDDTLELLLGGTGNAHRLEYTLLPKESGGVDSTVKDFGRKAITWRVTNDEMTGRSLCVAGQNGPEEDCGPLKMVSDSVLNLGNFVYRLLGNVPAK